MGYAYWGVGLIALTILQTVFIVFRKKMSPVLFAVVFAIDIIIFLVIVIGKINLL